MKYTEQKIKKCSRCHKHAMHVRNNTRTTALGAIIHLILIVITAGLWLVPLVLWKLMAVKVGGWKCQGCL